MSRTDADAAVEARIRIGWNKFRQLVPLLTNKDVSLIVRGRLYSSCVRSSMLHGSETWPVRKENVVALHRAEMRMVRCMCGVKLKDRLPSKELRERLGVDDTALVLQQNRLRWYGHVLQKDDDDWVKKCMKYEVEGSRPRRRPKKTWKEVVREDCQACKLNKEDAMDRCKWRKVIKEAQWSGWVWVGECFFWYRPTRVVLDQKPLNARRCCCCTDVMFLNKCFFAHIFVHETLLSLFHFSLSVEIFLDFYCTGRQY